MKINLYGHVLHHWRNSVVNLQYFLTGYAVMPGFTINQQQQTLFDKFYKMGRCLESQYIFTLNNLMVCSFCQWCLSQETYTFTWRMFLIPFLPFPDFKKTRTVLFKRNPLYHMHLEEKNAPFLKQVHWRQATFKEIRMGIWAGHFFLIARHYAFGNCT